MGCVIDDIDTYTSEREGVIHRDSFLQNHYKINERVQLKNVEKRT